MEEEASQLLRMVSEVHTLPASGVPICLPLHVQEPPQTHLTELAICRIPILDTASMPCNTGDTEEGTVIKMNPQPCYYSNKLGSRK